MNSLPPATLEFAHRMFDAAREGNSELLLAAIDAGLPVNLTNDKGKRVFPYESIRLIAKPMCTKKQNGR